MDYRAPLRSLVTFQSRAAAPASKPPIATQIVPIEDQVLEPDCRRVPTEMRIPPSVVFQLAIIDSIPLSNYLRCRRKRRIRRRNLEPDWLGADDQPLPRRDPRRFRKLLTGSPVASVSVGSTLGAGSLTCAITAAQYGRRSFDWQPASKTAQSIRYFIYHPSRMSGSCFAGHPATLDMAIVVRFLTSDHLAKNDPRLILMVVP